MSDTGAAPRSWVSSSPWLGTASASKAKGSHQLLQQTSTQTLLSPRWKSLRSDSLESHPPRAALCVLGALQLCCAFLFDRTHPVLLSLALSLRCSLHHGTSDFPGLSTSLGSLHPPHQPSWDKELHQQLHTAQLISSTCLWASVCTKPRLSCGKGSFSYKTYMFAPLRQALMPTFHTKVIK